MLQHIISDNGSRQEYNEKQNHSILGCFFPSFADPSKFSIPMLYTACLTMNGVLQSCSKERSMSKAGWHMLDATEFLLVSYIP